MRATAGEQSHVLEGQKENIEQFQKAFEEKSKEVEKLKADIRRVSERQSAGVARHQKSIQNYERALRTSTDYAELNKTQYDLQLDQTQQLTRTIYDNEKVIKELRATIHTREERIKELETSCKSRHFVALFIAHFIKEIIKSTHSDDELKAQGEIGLIYCVY